MTTGLFHAYNSHRDLTGVLTMKNKQLIEVSSQIACGMLANHLVISHDPTELANRAVKFAAELIRVADEYTDKAQSLSHNLS